MRVYISLLPQQGPYLPREIYISLDGVEYGDLSTDTNSVNLHLSEAQARKLWGKLGDVLKQEPE